MKLPRRLIATAILCIAAPPLFGQGFTVKGLPQQQMSDYEGQIPALTASAKQKIFTDNSPRKSISTKVLLAPIVHSYTYADPATEKILAPGSYFVSRYSEYWRLSYKGKDFKAGMYNHALQHVQDWTHEYVLQGLRARGISVATAADAVRTKAVAATFGTKPVSTNKEKAAIGKYAALTYTSPDLNDWAGPQKSYYSGIPNFEAVIYVRGLDRWVHEGEAQMNGEAILVFNVHHRFEVRVCTDNCKTILIPKDEAGDVVSRLFIPSLKALDDKKREEHNNIAIKLAARHNAEIILTAIDAGMTTDSSPWPTGKKAIQSRMNGRCLDVPDGKFAAGTVLQVRDCVSSHPYQSFEFTSSHDIRIGGLCVHSNGGAGKAGDTIVLWQCVDAPNGKWSLQNGRLKGMNGRCINISGANPNNGAAVILWDCTDGANNELWNVQ